MSAASGARSLRAMTATASAIDPWGSAMSSSIERRDAATELIGTFRSQGIRGTIATGALSRRSGADLEIHRPGESVGDRRPFLDMGHQRVDLALRDALAFHIDLDPHVGETDRFLADVAGAPHRRDVEVTLELKLELVDDPAPVHRVGMQSDRKTGTQRSQ